MTILHFKCLAFLKIYDEDRNLEEELRYPTGESDLDEITQMFISDNTRVEYFLKNIGFNVTQYYRDKGFFHILINTEESLSARDLYEKLHRMSLNISIDDNVDFGLKIHKIYNIRDSMEAEININKLLFDCSKIS